MHKAEPLAQAAAHFRSLLRAAVGSDADIDAAALLHHLDPLFARIGRGEVQPPAPSLHMPVLHSEHPRHGAGTPLSSAESIFIAALEDW